MRVKYSFSMPTISSGCAPLGDRREAADVREEHGHLAPLAAEPRQRRVRDQLLVDVLRHVLAEELLHLPLLAALDEVLVADAAEERERRREHRLRQVQPVAAGEQPRRDPAERRDEARTVAAVAHHAGSSVATRPTASADGDHRRDADAGRRASRMKRFDRMSSATAAWIWMPGILPCENGVSNTSNRPAAVMPTKTILSRKTAGSTFGFCPSRICSSE